MPNRTVLYDIGDQAVVTNMITDCDGVPADPSELVVKVMSPDGTVTSITMPDALITNPGVGQYEFTLPTPFDRAGLWRVRWETSGDLFSAQEIRLRVRGSRFVTA